MNTFKIDGLDRLRLLIIGIDSFTKSLQGIDSSRSFQLENCEELDSIEIGYGSFSDYSIFELKNPPSFSTINSILSNILAADNSAIYYHLYSCHSHSNIALIALIT